ncbi:hypothetical protein [Algirhabdus cladophorae]|uniref:hypothetical protein n=1 Tax=Algirhabdus cladophorae TaxID=3377108 RepID=UPI003B849E3C
MSDTKKEHTSHNKFDRPAENLATIDKEHAPWLDDASGHAQVKSQHRRYHSLFEDLMN